MAKTISASVKRGVKDAVLKGGLEQPHLAEIVQHFFDLAGGPRAVAKLLFDEFRKGDCTPATRTRIIDLMLGAMKDTSKQFDGIDNLGLLSDEDLERALKGKLEKLVVTMESDDGEEDSKG